MTRYAIPLTLIALSGSCLWRMIEYANDGNAWWAVVHAVAAIGYLEGALHLAEVARAHIPSQEQA